MTIVWGIGGAIFGFWVGWKACKAWHLPHHQLPFIVDLGD